MGTIIEIVILVAVILVIILTLVCYYVCFFTPHKGQNDIYNLPKSDQYMAVRKESLEMIKTLSEIPYEEVYIHSFDGRKLSGKYYHYSVDAPVAICFHGYRATSIRDFSGGAIMLMNCHMNVLLVDERGMGKSGGHTLTFGVKEKEDCLSWIQYIKEEFGDDVSIMLYGISMGAATVLLASGKHLSANVKGIVADSPYMSAESIIKEVCRSMFIPPALIFPFIRLAAWSLCGIDLKDANVVEAVERSKTPTLIIHGEADHFVPCIMSEYIQEANPEMIRRETFPDAGHGISYMVDNHRYVNLVIDFMSQCLGEEYVKENEETLWQLKK